MCCTINPFEQVLVQRGKIITLATHQRTHCRSRFPVSVIIDDLYFKTSWRVSTSLKARQFGRIQWDSLKNKNRWNIHIQTAPLNSQARQRRGKRDWNISREYNKSLEMHSKPCYKSCICSVVLGQLESFRNHLGPQYYFPENFRCNFSFYESENFSDSSLHRIF